MLWRSAPPACRPPGFIEPCLPTNGRCVPTAFSTPALSTQSNPARKPLVAIAGNMRDCSNRPCRDCSVQWHRVQHIASTIAGVAAGIFAVVLYAEIRPKYQLASHVERRTNTQPPQDRAPAASSSWDPASVTLVISGVTCAVSSLGAFSAMWLAWRADRRQAREQELRFAQMQDQTRTKP
jgi:hypothetical protein